MIQQYQYDSKQMRNWGDDKVPSQITLKTLFDNLNNLNKKVNNRSHNTNRNKAIKNRHNNHMHKINKEKNQRNQDDEFIGQNDVCVSQQTGIPGLYTQYDSLSTNALIITSKSKSKNKNQYAKDKFNKNVKNNSKERSNSRSIFNFSEGKQIITSSNLLLPNIQTIYQQIKNKDTNTNGNNFITKTYEKYTRKQKFYQTAAKSPFNHQKKAYSVQALTRKKQLKQYFNQKNNNIPKSLKSIIKIDPKSTTRLNLLRIINNNQNQFNNK